tara:strand:+ start:2197 stop:2322 length:126 start_codon:yes stop_codon:yes gene_type:complete
MNLFEYILHKGNNPTKKENERINRLLEKNLNKKQKNKNKKQ